MLKQCRISCHGLCSSLHCRCIYWCEGVHFSMDSVLSEPSDLSGCGCQFCLTAAQLPQPAALYHNDCQHIGNQMLSLPYTYAPQLAQLAPSAPAQLVDAAQRLKEAGSAVLSAQV